MTAPASQETTGSLELAQLVEKLIGQLQAGERVNLQAFVASHPEHAQQLQELIPALEFLTDLPKIGFRDSPSDEGSHTKLGSLLPGDSLSGTLGDFRILREIGCGGMGVVYEAQQISLRRRVALKVLPFAGVLDDRQLQRFQNEAQAAALLRHENIVGVHAVGCERGVHYYAMELIEGQSIAQAIQQLRKQNEDVAAEESASHQPDVGPSAEQHRAPSDIDSHSSEGTNRPGDETQPVAALSTKDGISGHEYMWTVTRLAVQAANALEYAHQHGVIHRDIKPSNLLLDKHGRLWVTDFGLALIQGEGHLTMTGDLLGTLRYMSPEQAAGHKFVDPRTDVYSLGITLYELLALRPAFTADNRQQLLRQVIEQQPQSLRRLSPKIPHDLETIVLKATAKGREGRYETAQQLADDLNRFLEHRPIKARRTSRAEYLWRWARRNPVLACLIVTTTCLLVFLAVAGPLMAWRLRSIEAMLRNQLYDARMTAAHAALQEGAVERVDDLLRIYLPSRKNQKDLRGFEWYHLWRESRRAIESPQIPNWISIESLDYSPDGRHFAYGAWDGELVVLDDRTRDELWSSSSANTGHTFVISSTRFSPDGRLVATASYDKSVILWNAASGDVLASLEFPRAASAVAFSPDSKLLAIGLGVLGEDPLKAQLELIDSNEVQLYDVDAVTNGSELVVEATFKRSLEGCKGWVSSLSFSQDGQWLTVASREAHFCLWNLVTGKSHHIPVYEAEGKVRCAAFSPVDKHLLVTGGGGLTSANRWGETRLWDVDNKSVQSITRFPAAVIGLAFSADGTRLATVDDRHTIGIFNVNDALQRADTIRGHSADINNIAFSANGRTLASCSADNKIVFWDISQPPLVKTIDAHLSAVVDLDFATDGVIVSAGSDGTARVWDTNSGQKLQEFPVTVREAFSIDVSPDGSTVAVAGGEYPERTPGELSLWSLVSGTKLRTLYDGPHTIWSARFSPDGRRIAAGLDREAARDRGAPGELIIWGTRTFQELQRLKIEPRPHVRRLAWSPDGKHIATCTVAPSDQEGHGPVQLWSLETESSETVYPNTDGVNLCALAYSADGSMIAAGSCDGWIRVWQISDGKRTAAPETLLSAHIGFVWYLDFSPDSRRLVSAGADGTVRIWNVATGWELMTFRDDSAWQFCAKFSDDGRTLAVGNRGIKTQIRFYRGASDQDLAQSQR